MPPRFTDRIQYILEQRISTNTNRSYMSAFKRYVNFCHQYNLQPLPVTELNLMYYMAARLEQVKPGTIRHNYFAIKSCATMYGHDFEAKDMPTLRIMRNSMAKIFGGNLPDKRLPFTFKMLAQSMKYFDFNQFDEIVYFTMMVCACTALLRTGEFCARSKAVSPRINDDASVRALFIRNLHMHRRENGRLSHYTCTLRATKADTLRQDVQAIFGEGKMPISANYWLTRMLKLRCMRAKIDCMYKNDPSTPLFQLRDGSIATRNDLNKRFKTLIHHMGLDSNRYTLYSFRIGGATSLARRGVSHKVIQMLGRWKSDAYQLYIRMSHHDLARAQKEAIEKDIVNPNLVYAHQNVPQEHIISANE